MSPALAGGFFTTSATWEAQCDLTSVCDSSSAQIKLLKFLLVISVQRKGSWRLVLGVCGHRRAEEKKTDNQCSHIYVLAGNWGALLRIERMVTQLSNWFLNLSFEIISYWIVSSSLLYPFIQNCGQKNNGRADVWVKDSISSITSLARLFSEYLVCSLLFFSFLKCISLLIESCACGK